MKNLEEQLSVRWHFHAGEGALIWHLMFNQTGALIGQKRFVTTRKALFFSLDALTGEVFCDDYLLMDHGNDLPVGEGWLVGLETTREHLLYCYSYQQQSPEHIGIWAVDLRVGKVVWSRLDIVFVANLDHQFLVYRPSVFAGFPERHFFLIDPSSGADICSLGQDGSEVNALRGRALTEEERQGVELSRFVTENMVEERRALERAGIAEPTRCECIVHGSFTVAAFHEPARSLEGWHSFLRVWSLDRLVYSASMEESAERPCLNNFLIRGDNLYYLKDKEELTCVALS